MDVGEEGGEVVVELGLEVSLLDLGLLERKDVLKERNGEVIWFIVAVLMLVLVRCWSWCFLVWCVECEALEMTIS